MKNFEEFVAFVCERLYQISEDDPQQITSCRSGEDFEERVFVAANDVIRLNHISAIAHYTPGSHVFPDIVIEYSDGDKYGIEVKCSTSSTSRSWKINGNSVLGSTKEDVIDTFIVFGKTKPGNIGFRFKRYEEAISNVVVTHSPRYLIDLDVSEEDNFFNRSGLSYQQVNDSDNPIGLITEYFRRQGQRAWWLAESTPAAIRMFSDLSRREQSEMIGYCFAHYPEVFSSGTKKYSRSAMWMVTERSVVSSSLRDNFSAGGKVNITTPSSAYQNLPRVFLSLLNHRNDVIRELRNAESKSLHEDWFMGEYTPATALPDMDEFDSRVEYWANTVTGFYDPSSREEGRFDSIKEMIIDILLYR